MLEKKRIEAILLRSLASVGAACHPEVGAEGAVGVEGAVVAVAEDIYFGSFAPTHGL